MRISKDSFRLFVEIDYDDISTNILGDIRVRGSFRSCKRVLGI